VAHSLEGGENQKQPKYQNKKQKAEKDNKQKKCTTPKEAEQM
jgi:hypothetical protein